MNITALDLASRYINIAEMPGSGQNHPLIQWWLSLCGFSTSTPDEVAWCSAFVNGIAWELRLPRSKSAAARSWLGVGKPLPLTNDPNLICPEARPAFDVVVLSRGADPTKGHVGFFAGQVPGGVLLLAGNQGNKVCIEQFSSLSVLGVRRLWEGS